MSLRLKITASVVVALMVYQPVSLFAWGNRGHQVIATLAARKLTPNARSEVEALLGSDAASAMTIASTWADEIRPSRRETAPWHYVNIESNSTEYQASRDCVDGDCVVEQIEKERHAIIDPSLTNSEKAEALRFLIHFVGDVHQPLHAFDHHDRGGNEVSVAFADPNSIGAKSGMEFGHSSNLHAVWDREMVDQLGNSPGQITDKAEHYLTAAKIRNWSSGSAASWANESFAIARDEIYGRLRIMGHGPAILSDSYLVQEAPTVIGQLERAGVRLAWILNIAFTKAAPPPRTISSRISPTVTAAEISGQVGNMTTVVDIVTNVHRTRSGTVFLDFGGRYPENSFSAVILPSRSPEFPDLNTLAGKKVRVTGHVQLYRGKRMPAFVSLSMVRRT